MNDEPAHWNLPPAVIQNITALVIVKAMTGDQLKAARLASSWTQNDAAAKLGVTQAYLSMVERGTRTVSTELAARVVAVLKVPATALPLGSYRRRRPSELLSECFGRTWLSGIRLYAGTGEVKSGGAI
jgi:transcriptional regulator with XRE-family HTH domain